MKISLKITIAFRVFAALLFLGLCTKGATPLFAAQFPFRPGEVLRYNIKQSGIKLGEATLEFKGEVPFEGRKAALLVFTSKGVKFYDEERIFLDPISYYPLRVERDLDIWGKKEKIFEAYSPDGKILVHKVAEGKSSDQVIDRKGAVDNIYGFIYRYRSQGAFPGKKTFDVKLPTLDIGMKVMGQTSFNAAGKVYQAAVLRSVPSKYTIWMDTGSRHLPLRIAGSVGIANTVMTLIEHKE